MSAQEMSGIETAEARVKANSQLNASSKERSTPEDEVFKAIEDSFGGFKGFDDIDGAITSLEEKYSEEAGEQELDEPMCKIKQ